MIDQQRQCVAELYDLVRDHDRTDTLWDSLTARERQVAERLARGQRCEEVGEDLGCSTKTVDTHRLHVLRKLGLRNAAELARAALARTCRELGGLP